MTLSDIIGTFGTIAGVIIGASGRYVGGLLNKKRDDTIRDKEIEWIKEKLVEHKKDIDHVSELSARIPVIEQRLKTLENE